MAIKFAEATVSYFDDDETLLPAALSNIDLVTPAGQSTLVTGNSGRGKTTLLCCLNGSVPHFFDAYITGNITPDGVPVAQLPSRDLASGVGTVFQNPRSKFFTPDVASELAFYCENFAMPSGKIIHRIGEVALEARTIDLLGHHIIGPSGGRKQKLAIGSAMALSPRVLLFDEPSADLNLNGLDMPRGVILDLKKREVTTVTADHHLSCLDGVIDRYITLEINRVTADTISDRLGQLSDAWFADHGLRRLRRTEFRPASPDPFNQVGSKIRNIQFVHPRCTLPWRIDELTLLVSGMTDIIGANGAGRTTSIKVLLGLSKSWERIGWGERTQTRRQRTRNCALAMRDVKYQLMGESAWDEMLTGSPPGPATGAQAAELLARTSLEELRKRHLLTLSGGQKQRLEIVLVCVKQAWVICSNEPTSGLDTGDVQQISGLLWDMAGDDTLVLVITHDAEFIESTFDHTAHIDNHQVVLEKPAGKEG